MPRKRLSMRRIREVLRLKHELRRSHREIARSLGIANSTESDYARRASAAGLSWPLPEGLDDAALEAALFPPPPSRVRRPEPDWVRVHRELQRHKGVTLELLWLEYRWRSGLCGGRVGLSCWGVTGRHIGATQSHSVRVRSELGGVAECHGLSLQGSAAGLRRRTPGGRLPSRAPHRHADLQVR